MPVLSVHHVTLDQWHALLECPRGLTEVACCMLPPEFLIQQEWGGAQEYAILTSFQVMLLLLIREQLLRPNAVGKYFNLFICRFPYLYNEIVLESFQVP